jgi:hypothetical protein
VDVHLILDNYAPHKHPRVLRRLAQRPRFQLHFTPTSASWLNLVERFFRDLSQDVVLPDSFAGVAELTDAIWAICVNATLSRSATNDTRAASYERQFRDSTLASISHGKKMPRDFAPSLR